jgi:gluconate 5-dehydrogenase
MTMDQDPDLLRQLFSLEGRVAIVTGASRGIGAAIAAGLHDAGATVIGIGRSDAPDWEPFAALRYHQGDAADADAMRREIDAVATEDGGLHILVNAAGVAHPEPGADTPLAHFDRMMSVNLRGAYGSCLAAAEHMENAGAGSIINVTSIASVVGMPGNPGYVAAKGGLRMLTQALAVDFGPRNIRVNNLAPGYVRTEMTEASYRDPALNQQRRKHTVLGRWGAPNDLIGAAIFLASNASSYVTGLDLFVDGGWTINGLTE